MSTHGTTQPSRPDGPQPLDQASAPVGDLPCDDTCTQAGTQAGARAGDPTDVQARIGLRMRFWCEVCGHEQLMSSTDAFAAGWDAPPQMGVYGVLSPRTCPGCSIEKTLWWRVVIDKLDPASFTDHDHRVLARIAAEPESMLLTSPHGTGDDAADDTGDDDSNGGATRGSGAR
jgi:hypothetical protein